nr:uncharacterized protein LOC104648708 [Solanum lycopersicum]
MILFHHSADFNLHVQIHFSMFKEKGEEKKKKKKKKKKGKIRQNHQINSCISLGVIPKTDALMSDVRLGESSTSLKHLLDNLTIAIRKAYQQSKFPRLWQKNWFIQVGIRL